MGADTIRQCTAWRCCDERYPYVNGIVTDRQVTVDAWREADIKFECLYPLGAFSEHAAADKARLDFLDECGVRLNKYSGTTYFWKLILNHNVNRLMLGNLAVDLNDMNPDGLRSCRDAIDAEIARVARDRAAA